MFSEEDLKKVPEFLAQSMQRLEKELLADIIRRIEQAGHITRTADYELYRLSQLNGFNKDYRKLIQQALELSDEQMKELYERVIADGYARDEALYKGAGVDFVPLAENTELLQLMEATQKQTLSDIRNITNALGFTVDGQFKSVQGYYGDLLNKTLIEVSTGAFDYNTALKKTVNELTASGVRYIEYESGRHDRIDVAVRRAVMTGMRQVTAKIEDDNAEKLHTELFEVSAHPTARPSHALWQGKIYTKQQMIDICGLGEAGGLCGVNCYHHYMPFVSGFSERRYTDEELSKLYQRTLETHEYGGKEYTLYEATQRMRALERRMRVQDERIALLKKGNADKADITIMKNRRTATYNDYKEFAKAMGLPEEMARVFTKEN
jgi:hypothetical protein